MESCYSENDTAIADEEQKKSLEAGQYITLKYYIYFLDLSYQTRSFTDWWLGAQKR